MARVSHRASHIPNRPLTSASRDTLPMRSSAQPAFLSHEHLPGITTKTTISHPSSPSTLASPTETEFGHTPIDATFGDRIDGPPDRPLPERPGQGLRLGQTDQRSRSGTATHTEPPRIPEIGMEKFAVQPMQRGYESDDEADDEYDRHGHELGLLSPDEAGHYDDDHSHASDSEDERVSIDGEDTPTTQGWGDRDGRSPTGKITQWNEEQVADYISSLGMAMKQYIQTFMEEHVNGEALIELTHDDLIDLGVKSVGHRLTILKSVYDQKIRAGVKIEDGDYIPLSAEGERGDQGASQDDIARVIESIRLRDQRILAAETDLRALKIDLDRISEENRKLREETLPIMRLVKDQRTPLPDPSGGTIPSPRDAIAPKDILPGLSRKFSHKKLLISSLGSKQPSPTYPPTSQPREVRDDGGIHLEASAAAMAASSHLTSSMTSQPSPNQQLSPTSPYSSQAPSSGGSYHHPAPQSRSFGRDTGAPLSTRHHAYPDETGTGSSHWSQASTIVSDQPTNSRSVVAQDRRRGQPSPRDEDGLSTRERERDRGDRDNPQVEIFKSFRVSIEDPCRVVLPVALKRYQIQDDWRLYDLFIVHGDQERCLGLEEKPLLLFKQLDKEGRKPMFMLRKHAASAAHMDSWTSGSTLVSGQEGVVGGGGGGGKHPPGGVL